MSKKSNKGIPHSPQTKAKMASSLLGRHFSFLFAKPRRRRGGMCEPCEQIPESEGWREGPRGERQGMSAQSDEIPKSEGSCPENIRKYRKQNPMPTETERKFQVTGDFMPYVTKSYRICQGYLSSVPERTVRVRIKADKGYITVKGIGSDSGMSRYEWEKEIPVEDASDLLKLCGPGIIDKTRHIVPAVSGEDRYGCSHTFEVDEFHGENEGLIIAEIELSTEDEEFVRPQWLGEELTGDTRYYNSYLSSHPYKSW